MTELSLDKLARDNSVAISSKLDKNSDGIVLQNSTRIVTKLSIAKLARDNFVAISLKLDKYSDRIVPS